MVNKKLEFITRPIFIIKKFANNFTKKSKTILES